MTKHAESVNTKRAGSPRDPAEQIEIFDLVELRGICFPSGRAFGTVLEIERHTNVLLYRIRNMADLDELIRVRREEIHRAWPNAGPGGSLVRSMLKVADGEATA